MNAQVLLVEDDDSLASMIAQYLSEQGMVVTCAPTGSAALDRLGFEPGALSHGHRAASGISQEVFDVVVLDLMLPDLDGFEVCRRVRARSEIPILMLTARGEETDRIIGLELGADDYLPKPFNPRELLARLRAILRRAPGASSAHADRHRFGRLEIDEGQRAVFLDGQACQMTAHQFDLLVALAQRPGRVMSRDALMNLAKGENLEAFDRSIDVHISRIRNAIEDDPKNPRRILTVRGSGYVFAQHQDADAAR